jgi:hypothetical protein
LNSGAVGMMNEMGVLNAEVGEVNDEVGVLNAEVVE